MVTKSFKLTDEFYIKRCIELALKGKGNVAPNPMVGAVIVHDNIIIGEGFHQKYGEAHAEVNAINAVENKSLLSESTIYVSLEPCAHYGKTPPCADLIIKHQFKKVVIGCVDSFSKVAGKGIEKIQQAGIDVKIGVLEQECRTLNKRFFTFHEKRRPYIILKWAQTQDGFIDRERNSNRREINWITHSETKKIVHQWRAEESAILVGKQTAMNDNPSLTVREFSGKNPIRILLDSKLEVSQESNVFSKEAPTIIFNTIKSERNEHLEWIKIEKLSPDKIVKTLHAKNIQSVIIEGGQKVLASFIQAKLWDEARILIGSKHFETGLKAPQLSTQPKEVIQLGVDLLQIHFKE